MAEFINFHQVVVTSEDYIASDACCMIHVKIERIVNSKVRHQDSSTYFGDIV
jgi:hypothetical protein